MDVFLLGLYVKTVVGEGRPSMRDWEGDDWLRVAVYAALALGRASYVIAGNTDDAGKDEVLQAAKDQKSL